MAQADPQRQIVVRAQGLGKRYARRSHGLLPGFLGRKREESAPLRRDWALRDVSLDVGAGEIVGVIGRNGAGKSTLLRILSRISAPTLGALSVRGRVTTLLDVGAGFHPDLTGRENIALAGGIFGLSRRDIAAGTEAIAAFAELEGVIDEPLKHYSSGMQMRLGFAVATHASPDLLLIDEVLAVGDLAFQQRCLERIHELARGGTGILLVTHDLQAVQTLCRHAYLLDGGRIAAQGAPADVVAAYQANMAVRQSTADAQAPSRLRFGRFWLGSGGRPATGWTTGEAATLGLEVEALDDGIECLVTIDLLSDRGALLWRWTPPGGARLARGTQRFDFALGILPLQHGVYHLAVLLHDLGNGTLETWMLPPNLRFGPQAAAPDDVGPAWPLAIDATFSVTPA